MHADSARAAATELRIGYQKSSTLIVVLKAQGTLEKALAPLGVHVTWAEFASGLPLVEALNANAVDFSADVADTVPIFAQAARADFVYVAQEAPSPSAQAIVVHKDAAAQTVADLKGKRIAVAKAAGAHYLLLAALRRAGLTPNDVQIAYLAPADGRAALETGSVDAWVTWDPYLASVEHEPGLRVLTDGRGLASYQRYYLASKPFADAHPEVLKVVYDALVESGVWVKAHPDEAARLLAPVWGLDAATVERANARRSYAVRLVVPEAFGEQQAIADAFTAAGFLPQTIDTRRVPLWKPAPSKQ
ncbi:aliphatic sulfonate ABC transporter substrate-binding protein [Pararobbsia silviterrae]|uniref:Putative aliphatic sulfonates-binding protein n=1 Tax=Pararobbsia silviterrae TaxID=1792498 RepID=A0A494XXQ2_9BURK|nr:aliphatic sulfonate ABC transporter substrate-binding protein [Pararobbsia silviterrae]RKP53798.1 aliphatic sulfonate ABC transporter substrate-binding protein [Pararobbsia silviterrae]